MLYRVSFKGGDSGNSNRNKIVVSAANRDSAIKKACKEANEQRKYVHSCKLDEPKPKSLKRLLKDAKKRR